MHKASYVATGKCPMYKQVSNSISFLFSTDYNYWRSVRSRVTDRVVLLSCGHCAPHQWSKKVTYPSSMDPGPRFEGQTLLAPAVVPKRRDDGWSLIQEARTVLHVPHVDQRVTVVMMSMLEASDSTPLFLKASASAEHTHPYTHIQILLYE